MCFSLEVSVTAFVVAAVCHGFTLATASSEAHAQLLVTSAVAYAALVQVAEAMGHVAHDRPIVAAVAGHAAFLFIMSQPAVFALLVALVVYNNDGPGFYAFVACLAMAVQSTLYMLAVYVTENRPDIVFRLELREASFPKGGYAIRYGWFHSQERKRTVLPLLLHHNAMKVNYLTTMTVLSIILPIHTGHVGGMLNTVAIATISLYFGSLLFTRIVVLGTGRKFGSIWCLVAIPVLVVLDGIVVQGSAPSLLGVYALCVLAAAAAGYAAGSVIDRLVPHEHPAKTVVEAAPSLSLLSL